MPARRLVALLILAGLAVVAGAAPATAADRWPRGFLWGTAASGFQTEAGGRPSNADRRSDWWAFANDPGLIGEGVVSGDRVARGPGFWSQWRGDLDRARDRLGSNAIRLGIEWSRIFPRSTATLDLGERIDSGDLRRLDRVADQRAVRHYRTVLAGARRRGLKVMLTLNHFTLPLWVHDPLAVRRAFAGRAPDDPVPEGLRRGGWLDPGTADEFATFAAYVAARLGRHVDLWATLNEPLVQASQGYVSIPGVTGVKAPGVLSYPAAIHVVEQLALGNAAAYDAIHRQRPGARVGLVTNLLDWRPDDPSRPLDVAGAAHADQVFNRLFLDAAVRGVYDTNGNGATDPGERRPALRGKADFLGVNHYSPARVQGLGAPLTASIPLFDFSPRQVFAGHGSPMGPPCPTTCTDFGWEIDPQGLRHVLAEAAEYGRPLYVTENGIDDEEDDQRPGFLSSYVAAMHQAIDDGIDVRGYFHWSLVDNFEWAEGFRAHFGLYAFDPATLRRTARPSVRAFRRIAGGS
ncbi:MAG TPA: glycoside hydrolase family 1 protein [Solirubrobacteraceae bacterium]|nr:glycoside hydrolase family 1 protein [Solirubrobacteraceae bacterium]